MLLAPSRALFLLFFLTGILFLCASLYLQYGVGVAPCGPTVLQRALLLGGSASALLAMIHGPGLRRWIGYSLTCFGVALAGVVTALRQVLRQGREGEPLVMLCRPDPVKFMEHPIFVDAVKTASRGGAECMQINWTLFELSLSELTLLLFLMLSLIALYPLVRNFSRF